MFRHFDAVNALIEETGEWLRSFIDTEIYENAAAVEAAILSGIASSCDDDIT